MTVEHTKLGGHVTTGPRDGWGLAAQHMRGAVSFLADAFLNTDEHTFTVWRPGQQQGIYVWDGIGDDDIMPGFDQLRIDQMADQAEYWWPKISAAVAREEKRLGITIDAIQCTNEVGGNDPAALAKLVAYEQALMEHAEADGRIITVGNCASNSPHWGEGLWHDLLVPHIQEAWRRGHVYLRHSYFDMTPFQDHYYRVFMELDHLRSLSGAVGTPATAVGPVIVGEAGYVNYPGDVTFMQAMKGYDEAIADYPEILFAAAFTYGNWRQATNANIMSASDELAAYLAERPFEPIDLSPPVVPPDGGDKTIDQVLWDESVKEQIERGIWLNPEAGLVQAILADGLVPVHREIYPAVLGKTHVIQAAEDMNGIIPRRVYEWVGGAVRWFGDPDAANAAPPLPWDLLAYRPCDTTRLTQRFGEHPVQYAEFGLPGHEGLDYGVPLGQPYYAAQGGRVVHASDRMWSRDAASNYGWHVVIDHGDCCTVYGHAAPNLPVQVGHWVEAGQIVGYSGNTGNSSGPHLHFGLLDVAGVIDPGNGYPEWKYGRPVDPWPFVKDLCAPAQPPAPPAGEAVDVLGWIRGEHRRQFDLDYGSGTQTTQIWHLDANNWLYIKGENGEYERLGVRLFEGEPWIFRFEDTSESPERWYAHWNYSVTAIGAPWLPVFCEVGRWYETKKFVQHYRKGDCAQLDGGFVTDRLRLVSKPYARTYPSGRQLMVITVEWASGEQYDFGGGNVGFRDASRDFWFMGWLEGRADKTAKKPGCLDVGW